MAISNELSSEIAAAILSEKKTPEERNQLKDVILRVHSALQKDVRRGPRHTLQNPRAIRNHNRRTPIVLIPN